MAAPGFNGGGPAQVPVASGPKPHRVHQPTEIPKLDLVGDLVGEEYARDLRNRVAVLMDATPNRFPGAQPVSFAKHHLDVLERDNYFVSEKADGVRCLLYMHVGDDGGFETFLIDRKNKYFFVPNLRFPVPGDPFSEVFHANTILDGELVLDIDGPKRILRFLLFDCVVLDGESLMRKTFDKRLGRLREFILKPHDAYLATHPEYAAVVPFSVELKELQLAYHLWAVMQQQPTLKHGSDGLLFTARDAPYVSGQCDQMIKWKPSEENTADFKIRYEPGSPPRFFLQIMQKGNVHSDITEMRPEPELLEEWTLSPPAGRIVECRYDPEWPGNWRFMRFRDDKDTANFVDVLNSIMQSIRDNVGEEELLSRQDRIRSAWKAREAQGRQQPRGPPPNFGPPQPFGGPPQHFGGPPQRFGGPPPDFGGPPPGFGGPPPGFGGPPPARVYGRQFEAPEPPPFGGPPPVSYGAPPSGQYGGPPPGQFSGPPRGPPPRAPSWADQQPFPPPQSREWADEQPFPPPDQPRDRFDAEPSNWADEVPFNPDGGEPTAPPPGRSPPRFGSAPPGARSPQFGAGGKSPQFKGPGYTEPSPPYYFERREVAGNGTGDANDVGGPEASTEATVNGDEDGAKGKKRRRKADDGDSEDGIADGSTNGAGTPAKKKRLKS